MTAISFEVLLDWSRQAELEASVVTEPLWWEVYHTFLHQTTEVSVSGHRLLRVKCTAADFFIHEESLQY